MRNRNSLFVVVSYLVPLLYLPMALRYARAQATQPEVTDLWQGAAPGTPADWTEPEFRGRNSYTNVTIPTVTVARPADGKANGTAMLVALGGGFTGIAWNTEGIEPGQWLADRGKTIFILKYRVHRGPPPSNTQPPGSPLSGHMRTGLDLATADGIQAVRLVRKGATQYGIRPDRIGFIGFSAGAMTAVVNRCPRIPRLLHGPSALRDKQTGHGSSTRRLATSPSPITSQANTLGILPLRP